jgi:ankyrin repeat protein
VRLLIESGANIEANCNNVGTALWWAVKYGREAIARLLIENGADVKARSSGYAKRLHVVPPRA